VPDAVRAGGACQLGCRETVHSIIGLLGNLRFGVCNTRQVNHGLNIPEQRPPFNRTRQVGDGNNHDRPWEDIRRLSHRCPHRVSGVGKLVDKGSSHKTRCARHKYARHDVPRRRNSDQTLTAIKKLKNNPIQSTSR
jgi:hypothetical protein